MPLFELDEGRPRLVQPMQPLPASFAQDVAALLQHHLAAIAGEPLFPVRYRTSAPDHADLPELLALDSTGRAVVVEAVQVLDDDAVVAALRHAGAASRMTQTDLARVYHADPERFAQDFAAFREQVAFGMSSSRREGVRLLLVCSEVAAEAGDTVGYLRGPGRHVDVLQLGVVRGVDDRRLLDVSPLARHESARRPVEPTALRLVRSSEASFATAMAYEDGRRRPPSPVGAGQGSRGAGAPELPRTSAFPGGGASSTRPVSAALPAVPPPPPPSPASASARADGTTSASEASGTTSGAGTTTSRSGGRARTRRSTGVVSSTALPVAGAPSAQVGAETRAVRAVMPPAASSVRPSTSAPAPEHGPVPGAGVTSDLVPGAAAGDSDASAPAASSTTTPASTTTPPSTATPAASAVPAPPPPPGRRSVTGRVSGRGHARTHASGRASEPGVTHAPHSASSRPASSAGVSSAGAVSQGAVSSQGVVSSEGGVSSAGAAASAGDRASGGAAAASASAPASFTPRSYSPPANRPASSYPPANQAPTSTVPPNQAPSKPASSFGALVGTGPLPTVPASVRGTSTVPTPSQSGFTSPLFDSLAEVLSVPGALAGPPGRAFEERDGTEGFDDASVLDAPPVAPSPATPHGSSPVHDLVLDAPPRPAGVAPDVRPSLTAAFDAALPSPDLGAHDDPAADDARDARDDLAGFGERGSRADLAGPDARGTRSDLAGPDARGARSDLAGFGVRDVRDGLAGYDAQVGADGLAGDDGASGASGSAVQGLDVTSRDARRDVQSHDPAPGAAATAPLDAAATAPLDADPAPGAAPAEPPRRDPYLPYAELAMLAKRRRALTTLVWLRERRGQRLLAELQPDGTILMPDGAVFVEPGEAAAYAAGSTVEVDGWRSWRLGDGGPTLAEATGRTDL